MTVTRTVFRTTTVTASTTATTGSVAECAGDALDGTFTVVAGSAGAGQISYRLRLTNTGQTACFLSGLPVVQLLDATGARLPTHQSAAHPGQATAVRVDVRPGAAAVAEARFSPDVPGAGEQHPGPCEPKASTLRVTAPGGGSVDVPVDPPTPVCEQGALSLSVFTAAHVDRRVPAVPPTTPGSGLSAAARPA